MYNSKNSRRTEIVPPVDISASEDGVRLDMEMPGATEESLSVTVEEDVLTIAGDRAELPEGLRPLRRESEPGGYRRSFHLSRDLSRENIRADYRSGVLTLTIPRAEHTLPRRIEVSVESQ